VTGAIRYRETPVDLRPAFVAAGYRPRHFFPHRSYLIPTCGPDALQLSEAMCGIADPERLWLINLHAEEAVAARVPRELFFDDDLVWHQEHHGLPGHVAYAVVVLDGRDVRVLNCVSDVVQRQSRRPAFSARINNLFRGWYHMLFNALLVFARERGARYVHSPVAELVMRHTDPRRTVDPALFLRVYDGPALQRYGPARRGMWWVIDVDANAARIVRPLTRSSPVRAKKTICLCHDVERGLGHRGVDPVFAEGVDEPATRGLDRMLAAEQAAGVRATYNVVGLLFGEVRAAIEAGGHCLGFHSYDHSIRRFSPRTWLRVSRAAHPLRRAYRALHGTLAETSDRESRPGPFSASPARDQPRRCRDIDYRVRGYRPPQSRITCDANDFNLVRWNYRWLASSARSLGLRQPVVRNRIVKIPIAQDDHPLHVRALGYEAWMRKLLAMVEREEFTAISLHDCYAPYWLDGHPRMLAELQRRAELSTADEVAWECILRTCA
jgi:hypothetical protein